MRCCNVSKHAKAQGEPPRDEVLTSYAEDTALASYRHGRRRGSNGTVFPRKPGLRIRYGPDYPDRRRPPLTALHDDRQVNTRLRYRSSSAAASPGMCAGSWFLAEERCRTCSASITAAIPDRPPTRAACTCRCRAAWPRLYPDRIDEFERTLWLVSPSPSEFWQGARWHDSTRTSSCGITGGLMVAGDDEQMGSLERKSARGRIATASKPLCSIA